MNKRKVYIEHKLNNGKKYIETIDMCLWRQCVEDKGTTAQNWDNDHPCVKCNGYKPKCDNYTKR